MKQLDIKAINKIAGDIISHMEEVYSGLDDAQKRCILEAILHTYEAKVYLDVQMASIASMLDPRRDL